MPPQNIEILWASRHAWWSGRHAFYSSIDAVIVWLMQEGRMSVSLDGTPFKLEAGQAFLQFPGVSRELVALQDAKWASVALRINVVWREQFPGVCWHPEEEAHHLMNIAFEQVLRLQGATDLASRWRLDGATRLLLGFCLEHVALQATPLWLQKALHTLEAHPRTDLREIAAQVGYSPTQFRNRFRQSVGLAPRDYANQCLGERARQLLTDTDWSIDRIAESLGFAAATHFCRFFKRRFGMSPLQFRGTLS